MKRVPISFQQPVFLLVWLVVPLVWVLLRRFLGQNISRRRLWLIGGLRSLLIVLLGLALADPRLSSQSDRVNLFFCLDLSESIGRDKIPAVQSFMEQTVHDLDAEDRAGLIVFGKHPLVERSLQPHFSPQPIQSEILPDLPISLKHCNLPSENCRNMGNARSCC